MFQTGSGKTVKIKPSSLKKAASMLEDDSTNLAINEGNMLLLFYLLSFLKSQ